MKITLKAARVNSKLNQSEAAKMLGVSSKTLWNWENGKSFPNIKMIQKIEKIYKINYDDIIFLP